MNYIKLFQEYRIPMDLSRLKDGWVNIQCVYCDMNGNMHLGFNVVNEFCCCWKCGGHNLRMALTRVLNVPANTLDQIIEPFQTKNAILKKLNEKKPLNKTKIELPDFPLSMAEKNYLLDRHFSPDELIEKYNIRGGGWIGEFRNRIIIPIYLGGKLISWTSRTILKDREPRYKNLENENSVIDPKKIFLNLDNCPGKSVVLLEGPFDVLRFGDNGICGFGITLTRTQVLYLSDRFKKIYICFDNQRIAIKKAREYGTLLQGHGIDTFIVDISDYGAKDIGEMSPYKVKQLKKELGFTETKGKEDAPVF
jgi:hypothetical protein